MEYILILTLLYSGGGLSSMTTAGTFSKEACEQAAEKWLDEVNLPNWMRKSAVCVSTGRRF